MEAGRPSLYPSVISNTPKEMSVFSDFPYPEDFPVFLPNARLLDYLRHYVEHFGLWDHTRFGVSDGHPGTALLPVRAGHRRSLRLAPMFQTTVVSIRKRPGFATMGQWDVVTEADGKQTSHVFDAVRVCSGNFSEPSLPLHRFPGTVRGCLQLPASRGWGEKKD